MGGLVYSSLTSTFKELLFSSLGLIVSGHLSLCFFPLFPFGGYSAGFPSPPLKKSNLLMDRPALNVRSRSHLHRSLSDLITIQWVKSCADTTDYIILMDLIKCNRHFCPCSRSIGSSFIDESIDPLGNILNILVNVDTHSDSSGLFFWILVLAP